MKASQIFPSSYLKSEDLGKSEPVVIVARVETEKFGDDEKRVCYFKGKEKGLVLNRTNWGMLAEITKQDDDDNWVGHAVKLYVARVDYQGKRVPAIRIDYPPKGHQPVQPPVNVPTPEELDEEVPF